MPNTFALAEPAPAGQGPSLAGLEIDRDSLDAFLERPAQVSKDHVSFAHLERSASASIPAPDSKLALTGVVHLAGPTPRARLCPLMPARGTRDYAGDLRGSYGRDLHPIDHFQMHAMDALQLLAWRPNADATGMEWVPFTGDQVRRWARTAGPGDRKLLVRFGSSGADWQGLEGLRPSGSRQGCHVIDLDLKRDRPTPDGASPRTVEGYEIDPDDSRASYMATAGHRQLCVREGLPIGQCLGFGVVKNHFAEGRHLLQLDSRLNCRHCSGSRRLPADVALPLASLLNRVFDDPTRDDDARGGRHPQWLS